MEPIVTNIFCFIGKPGSGRETLLSGVLTDNSFLEAFNIRKLVCGTTRPIKPGEKHGFTYHFFTKEEFYEIDPSEIIESRSYDNIYTNDIYWYFTLKSYIQFGNNYVAKVSTFQYSEFKKWALLAQLGNSMNRIQIFPILITAPIFEREKRIMQNAAVEHDVYNMCAKFITEQFELKSIIQNNPELIDAMNKDTCIVDNGKHGEKYVIESIKCIESFIKEKLIGAG